MQIFDFFVAVARSGRVYVAAQLVVVSRLLSELGALACFVVGAVVAVGNVFLLEGRFIGEGLLVIAGGKFEIVGWKAVGPSGFAEEGRVW